VAGRGGGRVSGFVAAGRARVDAVRARLADTLVWRVWERLLENEFIDRSVALAAKAFVSLFPLTIAVSAFLPTGLRREVGQVAQNRFGLTSSSRQLVADAFARPDQTRAATGLVGLLFLFFYATTFTTALQRVYLKAWRRPSGGGGAPRGMLWLAGLIVIVGLLDALRHLLGRDPTSPLALVTWSLTTIGGWWVTGWLMLRGEVRWRALQGSALLTGLATVLYSATTSLWMPYTVRQNEAQFGVFGVTLALVSWFVGLGFVLVGTTVAAAALAAEPGLPGRLARGGADRVLRPGAAPALGPPTRAPTVVDALVPRGTDDT
jgi:membrane protein